MQSDLRIMFEKMSSLQWCCMDAFLYGYELYMQICALTMYITIGCVQLCRTALCIALQNLFFIILIIILNKSDNEYKLNSKYQKYDLFDISIVSHQQMESFRRDLKIVQKRLQKSLHLPRQQRFQVRHINRVLQGCFFVGHNPKNKLAFQNFGFHRPHVLMFFFVFWLPEIR